MTNLPREQWVHALSALPEARLQAVVDALPADLRVSPKALPQAGLGMLKMRDSAFGDAFYLGEFPLAGCWVTVTTPEGRSIEGAAWIMDDRTEYAEQLALCDAVMAGRLPGWEAVAELLDHGMRERARRASERKAMLARTKVDFSLLDDVGDDDD